MWKAAGGAAALGRAAQPLPPSSGGIFLKFLLPDPMPPLSLKAPPRPGQLRGASAQVTFSAAVTLGHPRERKTPAQPKPFSRSDSVDLYKTSIPELKWEWSRSPTKGNSLMFVRGFLNLKIEGGKNSIRTSLPLSPPGCPFISPAQEPGPRAEGQAEHKTGYRLEVHPYNIYYWRRMNRFSIYGPLTVEGTGRGGGEGNLINKKYICSAKGCAHGLAEVQQGLPALLSSPLCDLPGHCSSLDVCPRSSRFPP